MTHPPTNYSNMPTPEFSLVSLVSPPQTRLTPEWRHSETLESLALLALLALFGLKKAGLALCLALGCMHGCILDCGENCLRKTKHPITCEACSRCCATCTHVGGRCRLGELAVRPDSSLQLTQAPTPPPAPRPAPKHRQHFHIHYAVVRDFGRVQAIVAKVNVVVRS